jgi:hypothetical protein
MQITLEIPQSESLLLQVLLPRGPAAQYEALETTARQLLCAAIRSEARRRNISREKVTATALANAAERKK